MKYIRNENLNIDLYFENEQQIFTKNDSDIEIDNMYNFIDKYHVIFDVPHEVFELKNN